jgi:tripartite-type tricarboxylate transporter receptor subunit TctC
LGREGADALSIPRHRFGGSVSRWLWPCDPTGACAVRSRGPHHRPVPAGGSADVLARIVSQSAGESTRQTFIIENHPGAGASIAYDLTARAAPDGNTIVVGSNSLLINPLLRKVNYDSLTSFAPICNLVSSPLIFVVNAASPYKSIGEFIAVGKAKPGAITVAPLGPATTQHIAFEGLKRATKTEMVFVPFAGGAPAVNALLGNHVDAALINYSAR